MIQPISGPPPGQPPGQGDNLPSGTGNQPLSSQQRTSLESLMTKVTSLTQQQRAETVGGYQARYWSVGRFTAAFASLPCR
ncbi:cell division protein [Escherichia coli]|nr:cell division protein [Escherichia coli]